MDIVIVSNGKVSSWEQGTIADFYELIRKLETYTLDPMFEDYGNFVIQEDGGTYFWGNFFDYSAVFNVRSSDPVLNRILTDAIRDNQLTDEYLRARDKRLEEKRYVAEKMAEEDAIARRARENDRTMAEQRRLERKEKRS